jgi:lysophospholipase L1-like esterase
VRKKLPNAQITVVSIKPSPKRWKYDSLMVASNLLLKDFLSHLPNTQFVDVHSAMLNADGSVKSELFVADSFHMNPKGYAIWTKEIKPVLLK